MDSKIQIQKNGARKTVSTKEAVVLRHFSQALAGDRGAVRDAMNFMMKMSGLEAAQPTDAMVNLLPAESLAACRGTFWHTQSTCPSANTMS